MSCVVRSLGVVALVAVCSPGNLTAGKTDATLRRPVALTELDGNMLVANSRSGTISVIDRDSLSVIAEHAIAGRINDMVAVPDQPSVFVIDADQDRLLKVAIRASGIAAEPFADLPSSASRLIVSTARRELFVSGRWSRCVAVIRCDDGFEQASESIIVPLPFVPRELLLLNSDQTLLASDAFGGQIAVIDTTKQKLIGVHRIAGHNIRGMATNDESTRVYVSQQKLNPLARADYEDLHWGSLVSNAVRVLDSDELDGRAVEDFVEGWLDHFGGIGNATGDPGAVVTGPHGLIAVALSGIGEVAIRHGGYATRLRVGRRPDAMAVSGDRLYVANRFDDSISVIDLPLGKTVETIDLGPQAELSAVDRGELLFFDARLSHDGWMSCHSCHTEGHTTGQLVDTLGDGDYGAPKRVPSLLGTRGTGPWAWNGSMTTLAAQVQKSVTTTMHGDQLSNRQSADLVAYLESLPPAPPIETPDSDLATRGRRVFQTRGCIKCHAGDSLTSDGTFDVGLVDERNRSRFNPPSLRGVGQRDALLHDARAANLDDVVLRVRHQIEAPLSRDDSAALLVFLRSL